MACCVIASCLLIIVTSCVAELSRILVNKAVQNDLSKLLFQEFIASAELCAVCYELIVVAEVYGVWVYAVFLFALTLWWVSRWDQASACPYIHLENFLEGSSSFSQSFLACLAEIAGGLAICKYVQYTWNLQLSDGHVAKSVWDCEADLHVDAVSGAVIEGIATFMCRVVSKAIAKFEPRFGGALDAAIGTSLVVAAFDYSGGYFNPVLATSLKLNCHGHSNTEHFIVYWIGSTAGSVASWWLSANLHLFGLGDQHKKKD